MTDFKDKYLKYKYKYMQLKNLIGGYKEFIDIHDKYIKNVLLSNNYTLTTIKSCESLSVYTNDNPKSKLRNENTTNITKGILSYFMNNILKTGIKNDLYFSLPLRIFILNYIIFKIEGKNVNLLRSKKLFNNPDILKLNDAQSFTSRIIGKIKEAIKTKTDPYDISQETKIDNIDSYRNILISTNLSIFGNEYHFDTGESTYDYWLKNASQTFDDFNTLLKKRLPYKITEEFMQNVNNLYGNYSQKFKQGIFYQVLFPDDKINKYTFISVEYGRPLPDISPLDLINRNLDGKTQIISDSIKSMNEANGFGSVYKSMINLVNKYEKDNNTCYIPTTVQSRILITPEIVNDDTIKVFFYLSDNQDFNTDFLSKLDELINKEITNNKENFI
jgi:hypothetical protein